MTVPKKLKRVIEVVLIVALLIAGMWFVSVKIGGTASFRRFDRGEPGYWGK